LEALDKAWDKQRSFTPLEPDLTFGPDGLTLGCGAVLAKAEGAPGQARIDLSDQEARIEALLAAAYNRRVDEAAMRHLHRGVLRWNEGDAPLAAMHLALMGLGRLPNPRADAKRLFMAEALLDAGAAPDLIFDTLGLTKSAAAAGAGHYNPAEPRVPKGSGSASGEWMSALGNWLARGLSSAMIKGLRAFALANPELAIALGVLFIPTNRTSPTQSFDVPGHPDMRLQRHAGELAWRLVFPDGQEEFLSIGTDYIIRNTRGQAVGQQTKDGHLLLSAAAVGAKTDDEPGFCPAAVQDVLGHSHKQTAIAYEDQIKALVNPPSQVTPSEMGVSLPNPLNNGKPVVFDDCQHRTGIMFEAKGPGYAALLRKADKSTFTQSIVKGWINQAQRQVQAAGDRPIVWYFAEKEVADYARKIFAESELGLTKIDVRFYPFGAKER
jgi:hypothetical protein